MDGQKNDAKKVRPSFFPYLIWLTKDKKQIGYDVNRDAQTMLNWIKNKT